jgi:hypothetical protein
VKKSFKPHVSYYSEKYPHIISRNATLRDVKRMYRELHSAWNKESWDHKFTRNRLDSAKHEVERLKVEVEQLKAEHDKRVVKVFDQEAN